MGHPLFPWLVGGPAHGKAIPLEKRVALESGMKVEYETLPVQYEDENKRADTALYKKDVFQVSVGQDEWYVFEVLHWEGIKLQTYDAVKLVMNIIMEAAGVEFSRVINEHVNIAQLMGSDAG